jgi:Ribbon-helix-helix protein, copG family
MGDWIRSASGYWPSPTLLDSRSSASLFGCGTPSAGSLIQPLSRFPLGQGCRVCPLRGTDYDVFGNNSAGRLGNRSPSCASEKAVSCSGDLVPETPSPGGRNIMTEAATAANTTKVTRLSVNLSREVADALKSIASERGITLTEAIRRAISTQKFIEDVLDKGGKILVLEEGESSPRELVFLR